MKRFVAALLFVSGLLVAGGAVAGTVAVTFAQVGSDVEVTASGTLSETFGSLFPVTVGEIDPSSGFISIAPTSITQVAPSSCTVSP